MSVKYDKKIGINIRKILRECRISDEFEQRLSNSILPADDSLEKFRNDLKNFLNGMKINTASVEYASLNRLMAFSYLEANEEAKAINHLIESHAVIHRQQANFRFAKCEVRQQIGLPTRSFGILPQYMKLDLDSVDGPDSLKVKLSELPKEWYMVQITIQYEPNNLNGLYSALSNQQIHSRPIYLTILPTGNSTLEPFCITLPNPPTDMYDICKEIKDLLEGNKSELQAEYRNYALYWKMRAKQNNRMKTAVTEMENSWLKQWRIFFIADPLELPQCFLDLHRMIDKLIVDDCSDKPALSPKTIWILKKIATCSYCLTKKEITNAVKSILPDHKKLARNIILSINGKLKFMDELQKVKRKNLVLIIDEHMDYFPFEAMSILKQQPVTRFSCLHVAYAMFKEHEATIENGCKIVTLDDETGTFIVNPANDLPKMGKRLKLFIKYWLKNWKGLYNEKPNEDQFTSALVDHNVLMYCGHGSGIQYLAGEHIERLRVQSIVLLFGCSSVKLFPVGGRFPPYGVSNQYLTACSPNVLGMLWEVTDVDTDKMTTTFISNWIPSKASRPWHDIDLDQWSNGNYIFKAAEPNAKMAKPMEPEMLRALAEAKEICSQYMTSAAVVTRGLPIKLKY
ncbi:hypothetical protein PV327_000194 [Microctonus hyperodae]|uniref:separase n=1 Tax=Microctonus hyperodae TaxID=165561 RepID=A0AA39L206_MICHY|nr:hypothetical protein PV327_000194 [Microctonus hyperodae]